MNLFIDSNVVLDFLLERQPFFDGAKKIFELRANPDYQLYISAAAITDIYYIAYRTLHDHEAVMALIGRLFTLSKIAPVNEEHIHTAHSLNWRDFEDAVQYIVAKFNGMDAIITRNMKGFKDSDVKIFSPEEFLEFVTSQEEEKIDSSLQHDD